MNREIVRPVELGRSPSSLISVASGAVKREQLDNLVHARTALREVISHRTNTLELTLRACLWQLQPWMFRVAITAANFARFLGSADLTQVTLG